MKKQLEKAKKWVEEKTSKEEYEYFFFVFATFAGILAVFIMAAVLVSFM